MRCTSKLLDVTLDLRNNLHCRYQISHARIRHAL